MNHMLTPRCLQISVVVTGIDHWVWTAYCFVDSYFDSEGTVADYHQLRGRDYQPDPLAAGRISASRPIWTPREYFLKVLEIRMSQVLREWNSILTYVEKEVKWYVRLWTYRQIFLHFALGSLLGTDFGVL